MPRTPLSTSPMYCTQCGQKQLTGAKFCPNCGNDHFGTTNTVSHVAPSTSGVPTPFPEGLRGWNWGAAGLSWIWGLGNSVWISLLAFIPVVSLFWWIVLGIHGSEWAWKAGGYRKGEEGFRQQQSGWRIAGIIVFCFYPLMIIAYIGILSSIGLVSLNGARELARDSARRSDISSLKTSITLYYDDQQAPAHYVISPTPTEVDSLNPGGAFATAIVSTGNYLTALPVAPVPSQPGVENGYWYVSTPAGDHYALYVKLEHTGNFYFTTDAADGVEKSTAPVCTTVCQ